MAEEKKPGRDLASKIAAAYGNIPLEDREKTLHPDDADIQNPELDRTFEKLVETYRPKRPARLNSVVEFPSAAPMAATAPQATEDDGDEYECAKCGHVNPGENQFCGMCGAVQGEAVKAPSRRVTDEQSQTVTTTAPSGIKHHHHYYHHHHYRNSPYLLLAIVVLLGLIAWQQWHEFRQQAALPPPFRSPVTSPAPAPAVRIVPQRTVPAAVAETPASTPAPTVPARKPAAKPVVRQVASPEITTKPPKQSGAPDSESALHKFLSSFLPNLVPPPSRLPNTPTPTSSPAAGKSEQK